MAHLMVDAEMHDVLRTREHGAQLGSICCGVP
jgi:hypothetical protein